MTAEFDMPNGRLTKVLGELRRATAGYGVSDAQLLERFATAGDAAAFELLVWRHERLVFGVCRRLLGDHHDAEDAFQATFLTLARKARSIGKREALAGWLFRVAQRVALTARASRSRRAARERPLFLAGSAAAPEADGPEQRDLCATVDEEIGRLPECFRSAVVLCYLEGKTVAEAAVELGCPRGTVASRLARARERLRIQLARRGLALTATACVAAAPAGLVRAAVRSAGLSTTSIGAVVSAKVIALSEEVVRVMFLKKLVSGVAALFVLGSVLVLGGGLAVRLGTSVAGQAPIPASGTDKQPAVRVVSVSQPLRREVTPYQQFTGRLEATRTVEVRAATSGIVAKVHINVGADVKKGDLLFDIDSPALRALLEEAKAKLQRAEADAKHRKVKLERFTKLHSQGFVDQQTVDNAALAESEARALLAKAQADIAGAQNKLVSTRIRAPLAGRISLVLVNTGDRVTGKKSVLAKITILDPIGVRFEVDERTLLRYSRAVRAKRIKGLGGPLQVGLVDEKDFPHQGTLDHMDDQVNPKTGSLTFHGVFANPKQVFLPGMFARVRLSLGKPRPVLEVPDSAINTEQGKHWVYVVNDRNVLERRAVKLGVQDGSRRVIVDGLRPEDRVVTSGIAGLHPGDQVELRRAEKVKGESP
jgi:multidrug efflux system membrane fusion protein